MGYQLWLLGDNVIHAMDKRIAAVLVELDVSQGPPTKIDIVWGRR